MSITKTLSSCIVGTTYRDLSPNAVQEAKRCLLDGIGVMLAGSVDRSISILEEYATLIGGERQATLICPNSLKSSVVNAALVNGTSAHILDFDDTHIILGGHPTAVILPAVLALGEFTKASGRDILTAMVLGVEVSGKIARAVNPSHYQSGYHVTSTIGVFGAAAAAAKLLRLTEVQTQCALGIAGSMSSGLKENFGTMTKSLHVGLAASNGVKAALLAQRGVSSAEQILEGPMGFCNVMCSRAREVGKIVRDFGKPWEIEVPGMTRKKYPCCARTHTAIDGILNILKQNEIDRDELAEIICATDESAFKVLIHPSPASGLEAKFSMPFCLSIAFLEKDVFIPHFSAEWLLDPRVIDVMNKVKHIADEDITGRGYENRWASRVTVRTRSGDYCEFVQRPRGDPLNPFSADEITNKFLRCSQELLGPQLCDSIVSKVSSLEEQEEIANMMNDLSLGIISK